MLRRTSSRSHKRAALACKTEAAVAWRHMRKQAQVWEPQLRSRTTQLALNSFSLMRHHRCHWTAGGRNGCLSYRRSTAPSSRRVGDHIVLPHESAPTAVKRRRKAASSQRHVSSESGLNKRKSLVGMCVGAIVVPHRELRTRADMSTVQHGCVSWGGIRHSRHMYNMYRVGGRRRSVRQLFFGC